MILDENIVPIKSCVGNWCKSTTSTLLITLVSLAPKCDDELSKGVAPCVETKSKKLKIENMLNESNLYSGRTM